MINEALRIKRTLATDYHSAEVDLTDDQVWELSASGDPPAVALRTSYALRSGGIRVFPQFTLQGITLTDPHTFAEPVQILERRTNYLLLECTPFNQFNVQLEFWVPSSRVLTGRFKLTNQGDTAMNPGVDWSVLLKPLDRGEPMAAVQMGVNTVLRGRSNNLYPVFFLTGGPEALASAHPALEVKMTLEPGASRKLSWALASLDSTEASFTLARQTTSLPWDVESVKTAMREKNTTIEITSDETGFGEILQESQIKAHQLLVTSPAPPKRLTFFTKRQPDSQNLPVPTRKQELISFSQINAYDAWMLSRILIPGDPIPLKEIIHSLIDIQQSDGSIPWTVSPSGTASTALTPPLLAGIVCDVQPFLQDSSWLNQVYPPLLRAFKSWFANHETRLPVWENQLQAGVEQNPLFSNETGRGLGMNPHFIHSPSLDAMLFKECQALRKISQWLNVAEDENWLTKTSDLLSGALNSCWEDDQSTFTYHDTDSGLAYSPEKIHEFSREGVFKLVRNFKVPRRLNLSIPDQAGSTGVIRVKLMGWNGQEDRQEELQLRTRFSGQAGIQIVSSQLFTRLESIEITGMKPKTRLTLGLAGNNSEDISLLLPLWSGALLQERQSALIGNTLLPRYLTASGLATFPLDRVPEQENAISPFWNLMIVEGLLMANRRDLAAQVIDALMHAQMDQWQNNGYVSSNFGIKDHRSLGELDSLAGLPAIWPYLRAAGIEKILDKEIIVSGLNEHLPPFTVKYKGTSLMMNSDLTLIQTVKNEQIQIKEKGPYKIVLP